MIKACRTFRKPVGHHFSTPLNFCGRKVVEPELNSARRASRSAQRMFQNGPRMPIRFDTVPLLPCPGSLGDPGSTVVFARIKLTDLVVAKFDADASSHLHNQHHWSPSGISFTSTLSLFFCDHAAAVTRSGSLCQIYPLRAQVFGR